jgi:TRAP-type C4-dicarboxylate transport system permease small subunit
VYYNLVSDNVTRGNLRWDISLYSPRRWRITIALGAVILAVGIVGTIYFGSIDITQVVKKNVNPQTGLPNAVNGIPHASAQVVFEILIFIGLFVLSYGIATRYTRPGNKMRQ